MSEGWADSNGGGGAEVAGVESDANAVVDRKNEVFVPLAPVLNHSYIGRRLRRHTHNPFLAALGRHLRSLKKLVDWKNACLLYCVRI